MNIYERYGVKPVINVAGAMTRYGGALMGQDTLDAMERAAHHSVPLDALQLAASKVIAARTHAEAGIVTCGASAGLTLATAACMCGFDVARMNRLPDTTGMADEVLMPWHQVSGYDHALTAAGAKIVGFGIPNDTADPHEVHIIDKWELESSITPQTTAIAYAARPGGHPPLDEVVEVARRHSIPVIIDAAAQVPPLGNLHSYIDTGADLVCISGGKGIRGPQASAILCGRRDLVGSALLQMLDLAGERFDEWNPPADLIPKEALRGKPLHGIGRSAKVTREAIIGLLVALDGFTDEEFDRLCRLRLELVLMIRDRLAGLAGVRAQLDEEQPGYYPVLGVRIDSSAAGRTALDVVRKLKGEEPVIFVEDSCVDDGIIYIDSLNLEDRDTAELIGDRLRAALA
ncbi:MAG: aminotransferase class V-fold PLP-dependent enzyme [Chloroflexota bacterium]